MIGAWSWVWCVGALSLATPASVRVHVDASGLEPTDQGPLAARLQEVASEALILGGVPVDAHATRELRVSVQQLSLEEGRYAYAIEVYEGRALLELGGTFTCDLCTLTSVSEAISDEVLTVARQLAESSGPDMAAEPTPTAAPPPPPTPAVSASPPVSPTRSVDASSPLRQGLVGPMGITGLVVGGTGIAALVAGAVLLSRGEVIHVDANDRDGTVDDYRPWGHGFLWPGLTAALSGAVLVGIAASPRRRASAHAWLLPTATPRSASLHFRSRF